MARFQALTNKPLDADLEMLRKRLRLASNQKADLLREVTALAAWVVRQAERGRVIVAQKGDESEALVHPALERLQRREGGRIGQRIDLTDAEVRKLARVLDRRFAQPPALRRALSNLAAPRRRAPKLRWKRSAA